MLIVNHLCGFGSGAPAAVPLYLAVMGAGDGAATNVTWGSGWSELYEADHAEHSSSAAYAIGTPGSLVVTTSESCRPSWAIYKISGYTGTPVSGVAVTASTANPNPPNLTSGFGSVSTLWVVANGGKKQNGTSTDPISSFSSGFTGTSAYQALFPTSYAGLAYKIATAASDDPGTLTIGFNEGTSVNTIAVQSGGAISVDGSITGGTSTAGTSHTLTLPT